MQIRENTISVSCDKCGEDTKNILELKEANKLFLCDNCLQEMNRSIVEHLADNYI